MFSHILLPTDGSELAGMAVDRGLALAKALGAKVTILTIAEPFYALSADAAQIDSTRQAYEQQTAKHAAKVAADGLAKAEAAGVAAESVVRRADAPWQEIVAVAGEIGADLVAMASHGRRGLSALMLGSQTARVLAQSKVPVLVFR